MGLSVILVTAVNAVVPVVLLILLGYLLKQKKFITKDFVKNGNKLYSMCVCHACCLSMCTALKASDPLNGVS